MVLSIREISGLEIELINYNFEKLTGKRCFFSGTLFKTFFGFDLSTTERLFSNVTDVSLDCAAIV